ncbi:MAG: endonuclease/exonuclease/phosphatase family protein [Bacillota bacterium]
MRRQVSVPMATWNMNGGLPDPERKWREGVAALMTRRLPPVEIFCLQGCKELPAGAAFEERYGPQLELYRWRPDRDGPALYILYLTAEQGPGAGLTIVSRPKPEIPRLLYPAGDGPRLRPALGVLLRDRWCYTIEAIGPNDLIPEPGGSPSPLGADVAGLLEAVQTDAGNTTDWIVAGSFYRLPDGSFPEGGWTPCPPGRADALLPTYPVLVDPPAYPDSTKLPPPRAFDFFVKTPKNWLPFPTAVEEGIPLSAHSIVTSTFQTDA